jgi:hypothetical protein
VLVILVRQAREFPPLLLSSYIDRAAGRLEAEAGRVARPVGLGCTRRRARTGSSVLQSAFGGAAFAKNPCESGAGPSTGRIGGQMYFNGTHAR